MTRLPIDPSRPSARRLIRATAVVGMLGAMAASLAGCYRLRISESFWLHARPGPIADNALAAAGLPSGYTLRLVTIPVGDSDVLVGVAALRPGALSTVLYFGGDDFVVSSQGPAVLRALTAAPVNVVLLDYPGSGAST